MQRLARIFVATLLLVALLVGLVLVALARSASALA